MKEYSYFIDFNLFFPINDNSPSDFISTYVGSILQINPEDENEIQIGKIILKFIHIGEALNQQKNIHEIFDSEEYVVRIGKRVFDFDENDFNEDIQNYYNFTFNNLDLCIIQRIEIIDEFRRKEIGKMVLKNICLKFASSCGLFVVQTFPIQFESQKYSIPNNIWDEQMSLKTLDKDFEKSFYKLKAFYQKNGFNHIDDYNNLMFLNPAIVNKKLRI
ncbi:MAG: hypothetical protein AB8H03_26515 [Saprospiraceae bacterium]